MAAGGLAAAVVVVALPGRSRGPQPPSPGAAQRVVRHAQPEHGQAEQDKDGCPVSDSAAMAGSTWWWKAPAAANWVGP